MAQAADLIIGSSRSKCFRFRLYVLAAFAASETRIGRSGIKYFFAGCFLNRIRGLRNRIGLRCNRHHFIECDHDYRPELVEGRYLEPASAYNRLSPDPRRDLAQSRGRAVPHVDSRCVPRRAFFRDRVHAAGAKIRGFAALLRVFALAFPSLAVNIAPILAVLSALTMIVGNVVAIGGKRISNVYLRIIHRARRLYL